VPKVSADQLERALSTGTSQLKEPMLIRTRLSGSERYRARLTAATEFDQVAYLCSEVNYEYIATLLPYLDSTNLLSFSMLFHHVMTPPPSILSLASTSPSIGSGSVMAVMISSSVRSVKACSGVKPSAVRESIRRRSSRIIDRRLPEIRLCESLE